MSEQPNHEPAPEQKDWTPPSIRHAIKLWRDTGIDAPTMKRTEYLHALSVADAYIEVLQTQLAAAEKDRDLEKDEREAAWNRMKIAQDKLAAAEKARGEAEERANLSEGYEALAQVLYQDAMNMIESGSFYGENLGRWANSAQVWMSQPTVRAQAVAEFIQAIRDLPYESGVSCALAELDAALNGKR